MTTETKSAFAKRLGINKSHLSRGKALEWLVLENGLVNVEESLRRRESWASPQPHHRAHAAALEEGRRQGKNADPVYPKPPAPPSPPKSASATQHHDMEDLNKRLKAAEVNKREQEAEKARMETEQMAGNLIAKEDVNFALDDFGATLRSLMENFADRYAPVIHPLQTLDDVHRALDEAATDILQTVHDQLARHAQGRAGNG